MRNQRTTFVILFLLFATTCQAQLVQLPATTHPADVWAPQIASSPEGVSIMVYGASGDPLLIDYVRALTFSTLVTDDLSLPDPRTLTSGSSAAICWSRSGFYAAVNSDLVVLIYHADDYGNWDLVDEVMLMPNGSVTKLDMWGVPTDAAGPDVFLAVETWSNPPFGNHNVQFASHNTSGWSELETVISDSEIRPSPEITWSIGPAGPWPTIFYLSDQTGESWLNYVTKDLAAGWMPPATVPVPCPIAGPFDVVTSWDSRRDFLGLGMQPTCPCGTIHHQAFVPGDGWQSAENLTQNYASYDWPQSPCIDTSSDGRMHAFWLQEAAGEDFTPLRKTLEYHVLENGVWSDEGEVLNQQGNGGSFGDQLAMSVDPSGFPVLAWTQRDTILGQPQPQQIWVARIFDASATPENPIPHRSMELTAWPNPFNPMVKISFEADQPRNVRLDIFDARGRRVTQLLNQVVGSGRTEITWNGKDDASRGQPSGVYFALLVSGDEQEVLKLVLAE